MEDREVKRQIMKRRWCGPECKKIHSDANLVFYTIGQKMNQMIKERWPPGIKHDVMKWGTWSRLGYMLARTTGTEVREIFNEADAQPPVKRRNTFGEWQQSHRTKQTLCPYCEHCYCSNEDEDDSELDSDEEDRERREPIKCGYDLTAAGQLYCCECKNRFRPVTPPEVMDYGDYGFSAVAGRDGAESPTDMKAIPIMKPQREGEPVRPVFHVKQPPPMPAPWVEQIWPIYDPQPSRQNGTAEAASAEAAAEAEVTQTETQVAEDEKAKQEPEGGYADSDDEDAAAQWSTESSTPPPPTSPTSTASQPPSPPPSPMPSPPPSPPTSPEASPNDGTETPQLPPLIAATLPNPDESEASDDDADAMVDNQNRDNDQNDDDNDDPSSGGASQVILF